MPGKDAVALHGTPGGTRGGDAGKCPAKTAAGMAVIPVAGAEKRLPRPTAGEHTVAREVAVVHRDRAMGHTRAAVTGVGVIRVAVVAGRVRRGRAKERCAEMVAGGRAAPEVEAVGVRLRGRTGAPAAATAPAAASGAGGGTGRRRRARRNSGRGHTTAGPPPDKPCHRQADGAAGGRRVRFWTCAGCVPGSR